jgi:hypothetical protein
VGIPFNPGDFVVFHFHPNGAADSAHEADAENLLWHD